MYDEFNIVEWLIPKNEWTRPGTKISPKGLAIHWTGNIRRGAAAKGNATFFHNRSGSYGSAHYVLDDEVIYRVIPENEMGYHVGATTYKTTRFGSYPNNQLIGLEICVNMDADWEKTYDNAVRFAAAICLRNKWLDPWKALIRHYDVTGKDCPLMWTPLVSNASHVRSSVISMLFPKQSGESTAEYNARLAKNESSIQEGIKWVKSMDASGKIGDDGWNQFIKDVASAMNGTYKTPAKPVVPEKIEDKVVYYMGKYFADVDDNSWKATGINDLASKKTSNGEPLMGGSVDKNGKKVANPDDPITRAEAAILVSRAIQYAIEQAKK